MILTSATRTQKAQPAEIDGKTGGRSSSPEKWL